MTVVELFFLCIFILSATLIFYHHLGYPMLLKLLAHKNDSSVTQLAHKQSSHFPSITIIIPAYNEAQWIADKIRNCAMLQYPRSQLTIQIHCDGCSDNTAEIARETIQEMICADTLFEIIEHEKNSGKVAVINSAMEKITSDITVLTDTSALVSIDVLMIAKLHFENKHVGVVNGKYLIYGATEGEEIYWHYQNKIKNAEAKLATTMGSHGAFYSFRTSLFEPLEISTINDDFILPMRIVEKGYHSIYDSNLVATELEPTPIKADFSRRVRISAGNMQQIIFLAALFKPKFKRIAFAFASGKGLRLLTPYLLITSFLSCFMLRAITMFEWLFLLQCMLYSFAAITYNIKIPFKPLQWINYLVIGHTANLIGGIKYLLVKRP